MESLAAGEASPEQSYGMVSPPVAGRIDEIFLTGLTATLRSKIRQGAARGLIAIDATAV